MEHRYEIITPEHVRITFTLAGIGSRFIALLVDSLIQFGLLLLVILSFLGAGMSLYGIFEQAFSWYTAFLILLTVLILLGYPIFFEMLMKGGTPGKAVVKIRVLQQNGQPITLVHSTLRNIFRLVDFLPGFYGIGIIVMFMSPESKRVGDYLGGTIVIRETCKKIPDILVAPILEQGRVFTLYPIKQEDFHILKEFMTRRDEMTAEKRMQLADQLAFRYWEQFHISFEDQKDPESFLEVLLQDNSR